MGILVRKILTTIQRRPDATIVPDPHPAPTFATSPAPLNILLPGRSLAFPCWLTQGAIVSTDGSIPLGLDEGN